MTNIIKNDLYRFKKSKLFYGVLLLTVIIAVFLTTLIRQDIRLGISVFGDLMAFRDINDVIRIGLSYHNGLGIFIAILLSIFIGQEYQWQTWQHKWITNKSRIRIYLSKFMISSVVSVTIFLTFQATVLIFSNQTTDILTSEYGTMIISGMAIYAALGTVLCMISMLIKNSTVSAIVCICYVLLSETLMSTIGNLSSISESISRIIGWGIRHSIYGMALRVLSGSYLANYNVISILINSFAIIFLSVSLGLIIFRKYEL